MDYDPSAVKYNNILKSIHRNVTCSCDYIVDVKNNSLRKSINVEKLDTKTKISFSCPECNEDIKGELYRIGETICYGFSIGEFYVTEPSTGKDIYESNRSGTYTKLDERDSSAGYKMLNELGNLTVERATFEYHINNLESALDNVNSPIETPDGSLVCAEIKSILERTYSFRNTYDALVESIYIPICESVDDIYKEWNQERSLRAIEGLRHYNLHDRTPDYDIRTEFPSYNKDIIIYPEDVWTIESDATEDNPNGYNDSPQYHYGELNEIRVLEFTKSNRDYMDMIIEELGYCIKNDDQAQKWLEELEKIEQDIIDSIKEEE
jgi:hypothetical protein